MPKLTKRIVDSLRPNQSGKDLFYWDAGNGALKGFGVRLKPSGAGAFIIQYRNVEGRTRRMVLGKIGTLTAEEARAAARDRPAFWAIPCRASRRAMPMFRMPRSSRRPTASLRPSLQRSMVLPR